MLGTSVDSIYQSWKTRKWQWKPIQPNPSPIPRFACSQIQTADELLVFFGQTHESAQPQCAYLNDIYSLDLNTLQWRGPWYAPDGFSPRSFGTTTPISAGQGAFVLIFGGKKGANVLNDAWALKASPDGFEWKPSGLSPDKLPSPRRGHSATAVGDKCLIFGGVDSGGRCLNDISLFDSGSNQFIAYTANRPSLWPEARAFHCSYSFDPFTIYVFGGRLGTPANNADAAAVWRFDLRSGIWDKLPGYVHCHARYGAGVAYSQELGHMFVHGGASNLAGESDAELVQTVFAFPLHSPSSVIPIVIDSEKPSSRIYQTVFSKSGALYSFGGAKTDRKNINAASNSIWMMGQQKATLAAKVIATDQHGHVSVGSTVTSSPAMKKVNKLLPDMQRSSNSSGVYSNPIAESFLAKLLLTEQGEFCIAPTAILQLCDTVYPIFKSEPQVIPVRAPAKIFGDIHGQFQDLLAFFDAYGYPSHNRGDILLTNYVFVGDFVDRGSFSLEVISVLFALKAVYPTRVFLVAGDHEMKAINENYGFAHECIERFGQDMGARVWTRINEVFQVISISAVVGTKILCVHGGIGPQFTHLDDLRVITKPIPYSLTNWKTIAAAHQALWCDPAEDDTKQGYAPSPRGDGVFVFGADVVNTFCKTNDLDVIVRGHQVVQEGWELFAGGRVWTVFSATNYCGRFNNAGAMIQVDAELTIWPRTILPSSLASWQQSQFRPPSPPRHHRN